MVFLVNYKYLWFVLLGWILSGKIGLGFEIKLWKGWILKDARGRKYDWKCKAAFFEALY